MESFVTFEMVKCLQKPDISLSGIRPRKESSLLLLENFFHRFIFLACWVILAEADSINKKTWNFLKDLLAVGETFSFVSCPRDGAILSQLYLLSSIENWKFFFTAQFHLISCYSESLWLDNWSNWFLISKQHLSSLNGIKINISLLQKVNICPKFLFWCICSHFSTCQGSLKINRAKV